MVISLSFCSSPLLRSIAMLISAPGKVVNVYNLLRPPPPGPSDLCLLPLRKEGRKIVSKGSLLRPYCTPLQQEQRGSLDEDAGIMCEPCNGRGWLLCDFCKGQKTNVKSENNRIYRRCPSCRAIGYVLCPKCKVYKCVTFPDYDDGSL